MKVSTTRTKEQSMNLIAGTEGLTFEQALSAYADQVVAARESETVEAEPAAEVETPAVETPKKAKAKK